MFQNYGKLSKKYLVSQNMYNEKIDKSQKLSKSWTLVENN